MEKVKEKLTSVKLQPMINLNKLSMDLWCPVLSFGRKKSRKFNFPIIFKSMKPAGKLYDELVQLKGKGFDEVKQTAEELFDKYKKFDYRYNKLP